MLISGSQIITLKVMPTSQRQSGFAALLTLILIIVIAAATYIVGKQLLPLMFTKKTVEVVQVLPRPSQNVYYDKEVGFEFKFPSSGYSIIDDDEEKFSSHAKAQFRKNFTGYVGYEPPQFVKGLIVKANDSAHPDQFEPVPLTLWIFDNPKSFSIDQWYQRYWYYPFVWGQFAQPQKGKSSPVNISSVSGQLSKSNIISYRPGSPKFVYLSHNSKIYLFRIMDDSFKKIGEEILTSFILK